MPLQSEISLSIRSAQTGNSDFGGPNFSPDFDAIIQLTNGTGANQADILFVDERTVASAANDDLDLAGVLQSAFGSVIAAAEIVAIAVINKPKAKSAAPNTTNLTIGGGTNPVVGYLGGTTPTVGPIRPGGVFLLASPDAAGIAAVTAATADILRVANSAGAAATYQILVLARSVA